MQNPYEIDINQKIILPKIEEEISYTLPERLNKRCKITETSYQSIYLPKKKHTLKRKRDNISEETLQNMVNTKLKISK